MKQKNQLSIKEIKVEKLFGYYSYNIPIEKLYDISQLLIIYGDNGSGKTTILKLFFWLISTRDKSGYKTKVAGTKFKKFSITFENGIEIGAERLGDNLIGDFTYYVKQKSNALFTLVVETEKDLSVSFKDKSEANEVFLQILKFIRSLNISVFYLTDDRKILNSLTSSENDNDQERKILISESNYILNAPFEIKNELSDRKLLLEPAIIGLIDWIRTKVISGSKTGEKNSQAIFTDLIKNLIKQNEIAKKAKTKEELIAEIKSVQENVSPFYKLGLIDSFDSKTIITSINNSKKVSQLKYLRLAIDPYIDSINAKLKALEKLKDTIYLLINTINEYFSNKEISFNLNNGFLLKQKEGEQISFDLLSSGEKQLLLLFINTITSADSATIFIIDEPEISLNIKWQRKLIDTLLKFSAEKNIQYILSTHSLELLSSNLDNVTKLENLSGKP